MLFKQLRNFDLTRIAFVCVSAAILLSVLVLAGWIFHIPELTRISPGHIVTKFNTCLAYLLSGISLLLISHQQGKQAGIILAGLVLLMSGITTAEHLFHWNAGIDQLFITDHLTDKINNPGRMTIGTAIHLLFLSLILISIAFKKENLLAEILIIPLWVSSFLVIIGYLFQLGVSFRFSGYSQISPIAVTIIFLMSNAVFFSRSDFGVLAPFVQKTTAARVNRKALLVSIGLTLLFAWLRLQGELKGLYLHDFGILLMGMFFILLLVYTNRSATIKLNKAEEEIKKEKELSESLLESLPGIFFLFNKDDKILRFNKMMSEITGYTMTELENMQPGDFFPEEQQEKMHKYINDVFDTGTMTIEADLLDKDGNKIPYFFKAVKIEHEGNPCIVGTGINISERKEAEHEIQLMNMQLRQLTKHIDHLRENERINIAREIHDELGQQLTVLKMNMSWLQSHNGSAAEERRERIDNMVKLSEETINTIRKIASDLRPPVIEDLGIAEALILYSNEFEKQTGIKVNFFTELGMLDLSFTTSTAIYRIYQECLTNVARYAEATVVDASLDLLENELMLTVSDNGKGFHVADLKKRKSLGVIGMRERAVMIGGHFSIHSEPGEGTHVQVIVSLENDL